MLDEILSKKNFFIKDKFDEIVEYEIKKTKRYNYMFCLVLFSIDDFYKIKTTYPNDVIENLFLLISKLISDRVRETDAFTKLEEDEFSILLPSTNLDEAFIAVDDIRLKISKIRHESIGEITSSFGVTVFNNSDTKETLYNRADQALFRAKENGKNRVEILD